MIARSPKGDLGNETKQRTVHPAKAVVKTKNTPEMGYFLFDNWVILWKIRHGGIMRFAELELESRFRFVHAVGFPQELVFIKLSQSEARPWGPKVSKESRSQKSTVDSTVQVIRL